MRTAYSRILEEKYKNRQTVIEALHSLYVVRLRPYTRIAPEITSIMATMVWMWESHHANCSFFFLSNCVTRRPVVCQCDIATKIQLQDFTHCERHCTQAYCGDNAVDEAANRARFGTSSISCLMPGYNLCCWCSLNDQREKHPGEKHHIQREQRHHYGTAEVEKGKTGLQNVGIGISSQDMKKLEPWKSVPETTTWELPKASASRW